jgi:hypothetical protein
LGGAPVAVGDTPLSPHNTCALTLLALHRNASSQLKRQLQLCYPCVGHSWLLRSYDKSRRCTQHPRLATLLADLQQEQDYFAYWCYDPDSYHFRYGTTCPYLRALV